MFGRRRWIHITPRYRTVKLPLVRCFGCGKTYDVRDDELCHYHTYHTGDTGFHRDVLLELLQQVQRERDIYAQASLC